jgi:hypothetical protein
MKRERSVHTCPSVSAISLRIKFCSLKIDIDVSYILFLSFYFIFFMAYVLCNARLVRGRRRQSYSLCVSACSHWTVVDRNRADWRDCTSRLGYICFQFSFLCPLILGFCLPHLKRSTNRWLLKRIYVPVWALPSDFVARCFFEKRDFTRVTVNRCLYLNIFNVSDETLLPSSSLHEDGGSIFLRNIDRLQGYTVPQFRRPYDLKRKTNAKVYTWTEKKTQEELRRDRWVS